MADAMLYRLDDDGERGEPLPVQAVALSLGRLDAGVLVPTVDGWADLRLDVDTGPILSTGSRSIEFDLDPATVPDLLALFFCQLDDHEHDGRTCVPSWIRLGED